MKLLILTSIFILSFQCHEAFAGGTSGGGGSGIVLPDGEVHLVDILSSAQTDLAASTSLGFDEVIAKYYKPHQFVRQLGVKDSGFFNCAITVLSRSSEQFPVIKNLIPSLGLVDVLQMQVQIASVNEGMDYNGLNLNYPLLSTASHRLPVARQVALATYVNAQLWITERLYSRMNAFDQCGLSVHESLRHLNFSGLINQVLTQDEIEVATRFFMGVQATSDSQSMIKIFQKLNDATPTTEELAAKAKLDATTADQLTQEQIALGVAPSDPIAHAEWIAKDENLNRQISILNNESSSLAAGAVSQALNRPDIRSNLNTGLVIRALIYGGITEQLRGFERWDVINLKKVRRLN